MASAVARAYRMGVWGLCPQRGPGAEPLFRGRSPQKLNTTISQFSRHFGKNSKFLQIVEVRPTCLLAVSFVSINDVALTR